MDIERVIKEIKKEIRSIKDYLEGIRGKYDQPSVYSYGELNGRINGLEKALEIIENIGSWSDYSI